MSSRLTRLSSSSSSRCGLDDRSAGTAPKVATRELFEGRGPRPQVPAVRPGLQGQAQPVEAFEVRVRWPQELQLRAMRAQFYAERQSTPSPDAEPQLLSAAKEAVHSEDRQMKSSAASSLKIVRSWNARLSRLIHHLGNGSLATSL